MSNLIHEKGILKHQSLIKCQESELYFRISMVSSTKRVWYPRCALNSSTNELIPRLALELNTYEA